MPYLGLAVGTALLLVAIRNRVHVGLAAAVAALVVAAMSGNGMNILARALHDTVIDSGGLTLLISIALITMIGSVMKASGAMDGLMRGISSLARDSRSLSSSLLSWLPQCSRGCSLLCADGRFCWRRTGYEPGTESDRQHHVPACMVLHLPHLNDPSPGSTGIGSAIPRLPVAGLHCSGNRNHIYSQTGIPRQARGWAVQA